MITILLNEFDQWRQRGFRQHFSAIAVLMAVYVLFFNLNPMVFLMFQAIAALWPAWLSASMTWNQNSPSHWIERTSTLSWLLGKSLSMIAILLLQWFVFFPLILVVSFVWGIPFEIWLIGFGICFLSAITLHQLMLLPLHSKKSFSQVWNYALLVVWILASSLIVQCQSTNPLIQIWRYFQTQSISFETIASAMAFPLACFGLSLLLFRLRFQRQT